MTYLEAMKLLANVGPLEKLPLLLAMSGTADQLVTFLRAHAVRMGFDAQVGKLPFGTLAQHLYEPAMGVEAILLMPWDLAPECDWRSGIGGGADNPDSVLERATRVAALLDNRPRAHILYVPAPIPPIFSSQANNARLSAELTAIAVRAGAHVLPESFFSLGAYLTHGTPVPGNRLSDVAEAFVGQLLAPPRGACKVLVTDADNTLWLGIVGEDGVDKVSAEPEGNSFRHFIYQSFLSRLKAAGILLAVVSRNDEDLVRAPFLRGQMPLKVDDFVDIRAGYGAKSDHINSLALSLNLGLDSIVFVDDNPVELAEVSSVLSRVTCVQFPSNDDQLVGLLDRLASLFDRSVLTAEDAERTEMYRRRIASQPPPEMGNVLEFLRGLNMTLTLRDRSRGDWVRAHQLINKTNQFNLNGRRFEETEIAAILADGGQIFTASLEDRTGAHGEILACLLDKHGRILSLVMSCRVFQRRVEFAFMAWLAGRLTIRGLDVKATERNEPVRNFLLDKAFHETSNGWAMEPDVFLEDHTSDLSLFTVREEN